MSLATNVTDLATRVATEMKAHKVLINGNALDLSALTTTAKTNLVAAINEVKAAQASSAGINDATTTTTSTWSSSKVNSEIAAKISALVAAAPGLLDTLDEIAAALGDDPNFATTMTNALAGKAPLASPTFTGTPSAPTATAGTNTTQIATTAFVQAAVPAAVPAASDTVQGKVELATSAETITGSDATRAVTPAGLMAAVGNTATDFVATFNAGLI
jgi:hypothetical protein